MLSKLTPWKDNIDIFMEKNFLAQFFSQSKLGEKAFQYADRLKVKGRVGNTLET